MTFKDLKNLLNSIEDDFILEDDLRIEAFVTGIGWDLLDLKIELERQTLCISVDDYKVTSSEILAIIPEDCSIIGADGEELA